LNVGFATRSHAPSSPACPNAKVLARKVHQDPGPVDDQPLVSDIVKTQIVRKLSCTGGARLIGLLVMLIFAGFCSLFSLRGETFRAFLVNTAKCNSAPARNGVNQLPWSGFHQCTDFLNPRDLSLSNLFF
jgi:hypothetical protein